MEIDPPWTPAELSTAAAWLAARYARTTRDIDPTHAQGYLAEQLVMNRLGDAARVAPLLMKWRRAHLALGPPARQKEAAGSPDWLLLDGNAAVTATVEVKAVRGDAGTIDEDRRSYRSAWVQLPGVVLVTQQDWLRRINLTWCGHGPRFASQIANHIVRLSELTDAGVVRTARRHHAILYVPHGERYFDLPPTIQVESGSEHRLEVRHIPALEVLVDLIRSAFAVAFPGRRFPLERLQSGGRSTADEVMRRMAAMQRLLPGLYPLLGARSPVELDVRLALLILGPGTLFHPRMSSLSLSWQHREGILERLHSVAPSLIAQVLFDAVAGRNGSSSKEERDTFYRLVQDQRAPFTDEQAAGVLACITRLRLRLRNREWPIPPLDQTIRAALAEPVG